MEKKKEAGNLCMEAANSMFTGKGTPNQQKTKKRKRERERSSSDDDTDADVVMTNQAKKC
jgi:hypothetical protein